MYCSRLEVTLHGSNPKNFCARFIRNPDGSFTILGPPFDRRKLQALNVQPVLSEAPIVVEGHAFTAGVVPRTSSSTCSLTLEWNMESIMRCSKKPRRIAFAVRSHDGGRLNDPLWQLQAVVTELAVLTFIVQVVLSLGAPCSLAAALSINLGPALAP